MQKSKERIEAERRLASEIYSLSKWEALRKIILDRRSLPSADYGRQAPKDTSARTLAEGKTMAYDDVLFWMTGLELSEEEKPLKLCRPAGLKTQLER